MEIKDLKLEELIEKKEDHKMLKNLKLKLLMNDIIIY